MERVEKVDPNRRWVVSDVRFLNEAKILREAGFLLVKVVRPGYGAKSDGSDFHQSEVELEQIESDVVVLNDGTLEDLESKAGGLLHFGR